MSNLQIKLSPEGELLLVLPEGEELKLPERDEGEVLRRVLLQHERQGRIGSDRAATRFYMIHLERHQDGPQEHAGCQWCQEEAKAELVLRHPVTKIAMSAASMKAMRSGEAGGAVGAISDDLAEELF